MPMKPIILLCNKKSILLTKKHKSCRIYQLMSEFINPMSHEEYADLSAMGVVIQVQDKVRRAISYQNDLLDLANKHEEPIDATNVAIYSGYETPQILSRHYRVIMGPKYRERERLQHGIVAMAIRFPVRSESFIPEEVVNDNSWNDIFLQVWKESGESQNFLLNSQGIIPFENALEDVEFDNFSRTHDMFTVIRPVEPRFSITLDELKDVVKEYHFHPQSNDDEPPFFEPSI